MGNGKGRIACVHHDHAERAAIIAVDGPRRVGQSDPMLQGQTGTRADLHFEPFGDRHAQARGHQSPRAGRIILGLMDTLQTLPSFVYLIPVIMLFRVGDFSAMIAVVLYALAPAVRYAAHGLRDVPEQMIEAGVMSGCTKRQLLWRVKLPLATPQLLLGLNQYRNFH